MKTLSLLALSAITFLVGFSSTGCEMHPPAETIPGYAEKEAAKKAREMNHSLQPEPTKSQAPTYFPKATPEN